MQIYNILPVADGSWKAELVGEDALVVSYGNKQKLMETMAKWAENSGDAITIRIHNEEGVLEEELTYPLADTV